MPLYPIRLLRNLLLKAHLRNREQVIRIIDPMAYRYQILLGKIARVNGYEGYVTVKLEKAFIEDLPDMESVFIETEGRPVPFFISASEYPGGDLLKLKFEGYEAFEKVSEFTGCRVFLTTVREENIPECLQEPVIGFKVILSDGKEIGTITEIIQYPGQDLMKIISSGKKEILIPYHEDFILKLDVRKKTIMVDIPEGLTDIN
jgi:16S rRNA processing protein RimM